MTAATETPRKVADKILRLCAVEGLSRRDRAQLAREVEKAITRLRYLDARNPGHVFRWHNGSIRVRHMHPTKGWRDTLFERAPLRTPDGGGLRGTFIGSGADDADG